MSNANMMHHSAIDSYEQSVVLIKNCLRDVIRPKIQDHNGDIEFISYKNDIVTVNLKGACQGCPLSSYTLKLGILTELKKIIPSLKEVIDNSAD